MAWKMSNACTGASCVNHVTMRDLHLSMSLALITLYHMTSHDRLHPEDPLLVHPSKVEHVLQGVVGHGAAEAGGQVHSQ